MDTPQPFTDPSAAAVAQAYIPCTAPGQGAADDEQGTAGASHRALTRKRTSFGNLLQARGSRATLGGVNARNRLAACVGVGLIAFAVILVLTEWQVALLAGWDVTSATFIAIVYLGIRGKDAQATKLAAVGEDDSRAASEAILVGANIASLVGVAFALIAAGSTHGFVKSAITTLVVASVLLSWAAVHIVFTLRYARLYYALGSGIDFHADQAPDFRDFLYVALTIGMTFQVSDTDLNAKPIRMTAIRHALLSYLFGVVVFSTTINVIATLLSK